MPAPVGEDYVFQFHLENLNANLQDPMHWYLISHGEGKQLTVEHQTDNDTGNIQVN